MVEVIGLALLAIGIKLVLSIIMPRIIVWIKRRRYLYQIREYVEQLEKMDAEYKPEKPDVEMASRCKEYMSQMFPDGVNERTKNMSDEELIAFFQNLVADVQTLMDVNVDKVEFYSTDNPPACYSCGCYIHSERAIRINAAFILSRNPLLVEEQVYTIFHELMHARQWAAIEGKLYDTKDYGYSDEQIDSWTRNFQNYVPSYVSDELYRKQPVELCAFGFENLLKGENNTDVVS